MVNFAEVVLYDARSNNLVTFQFQDENLWKVRTSLFPDGYMAELNIGTLLEHDEYMTLGML